MRRNAFSLVELLVVLAVISVLAALLLPTMEGAIELSRRTYCMNNIHQSYLAVTQYGNDFSAAPTTPKWGTWGATYAMDDKYRAESYNWAATPNFINPTGWMNLTENGYLARATLLCPDMDYLGDFANDGNINRLVKFPLHWNGNTGIHYAYRYNSVDAYVAADFAYGYDTARIPALPRNILYRPESWRVLIAESAAHRGLWTAPNSASTLQTSRRWAHAIGGNAVRHDGTGRFVYNAPNWPTSQWSVQFMNSVDLYIR